MVQAAEDTLDSDPAIGGQLMPMNSGPYERSSAGIWNPRPQAGVWSSAIVMGNPLAQDRPQMLLAQWDHVIQALAADRSHQPFAVGVRLRRLHRRPSDPQPEGLQIIVHVGRKNRIPVMNQESVAVDARNRLSELLQGPVGGRMGRDIAVQNAPASHRHDYEHIQHSKSGSDGHQEISGHNGLGVIANKRPPVLRGGSLPVSRISIW